MILDELGYLALPEGAAQLVFQVISERNERASLIVTTNLAVQQSAQVRVKVWAVTVSAHRFANAAASLSTAPIR